MKPGTSTVGETIRKRRQQAAMSASELARRSGVNAATITRLEHGEVTAPRGDTLRAIAEALDLAPSDLLAAAEFIGAGDLPSIQPYLRSKYGYLSDSAQQEIAAAFADITRRHGYNPDLTGPRHQEDEN